MWPLKFLKSVNVPHIRCTTNAVGSLWATWTRNGALVVVTGLRTGISGVRKQATTIDFSLLQKAQTDSRVRKLRVKWGKVSFRGVKGLGTKLTDHLEPRVKTSGTITPLPLYCLHGVDTENSVFFMIYVGADMYGFM